ncbi:MAG: hypothetical protein ACKVOW_11720 [Chitinophagaceae bacterium]
MYRIIVVSLIAFCSSLFSFATGIGTTEALLIKEAKKISDQLGNKIWPGISKIPFSIVLVTDSIEYLVYHPYPSTDFVLIGKDPILKEDVYQRKRIYNTGLLATFPAVSGVNCIVVGTIANTGRSVTDWMITLLHEHFHQYVYSQENYQAGVEKLNLSGGDQTGMWMLNYPFPYDSIPVIDLYEKYSGALLKAVQAIGKKEFKKRVSTFMKEKKNFQRILSPKDYRYFSFQVWQEGLANYTEYKFLQSLNLYNVSNEVKNIPGYIPVKEYVEQYYLSQLKNLKELKLREQQRVCIYAVGFAEGIILDALQPKWRKKYLVDKFSTDTYFLK